MTAVVYRMKVDKDQVVVTFTKVFQGAFQDFIIRLAVLVPIRIKFDLSFHINDDGIPFDDHAFFAPLLQLFQYPRNLQNPVLSALNPCLIRRLAAEHGGTAARGDGG